MVHRTRQQASTVIGQASAETASPLASLQMYLLLVDYGNAREGVCNPEFTRRQIVEEVRDILAKPRGRSVACVKFIDGNYIEDVTEDILEEASCEADPTFNRPNANDTINATWDRNRDLRKHSETV